MMLKLKLPRFVEQLEELQQRQAAAFDAQFIGEQRVLSPAPPVTSLRNSGLVRLTVASALATGAAMRWCSTAFSTCRT